MKISKYRMRLLRILVPAALSLWTVLLPADVQERLSLREAERVALDNDPPVRARQARSQALVAIVPVSAIYHIRTRKRCREDAC